MDITKQDKLTKYEWESIERPVSADEQEILNLISVGYNDVEQRHNHNMSLFNYAKMEKTTTIENYLYTKFFKPDIDKIIATIRQIKDAPPSLTGFKVEEINIKKLKSADLIRLENMNTNIEVNRDNMIEFVYIRFLTKMFTHFARKETEYAFYLYTLIQLRNINVSNKNSFVMDFIDKSVEYVNTHTDLSDIIYGACDFIEKNPNLFKYGDITLYDHQKRLYTLFKKTHEQGRREKQSNLVLYIAPTGTGKTLSPIGLAVEFRVIFVCAARHVGMALAKSAISTHKCVAFAFGCETASDIRLHYLAAAVYKINKRSGGIGKVDNSVGTKVEIMICDAKSYLTAMHYMLSFNDANRIITYWDEPTIGMDYVDHPLHEIIHRNWSENKIPNMVLSSATLPKYNQLFPVINDFRTKFENVCVTTIESHDCNKSISILNKNGYCVCPHLLFPEYRHLVDCVSYCKTNMTLLRYFDLGEIVRFISYLSIKGFIPADMKASTYFENNISKIKMNSLKIYYLELIEHIEIENWPEIYQFMTTQLKRKFERSPATIRKSASLGGEQSLAGKKLTRTASVTAAEPNYVEKAKAASINSGGILLTTADAHTLTDGPTIYLTENIKTIGNFYIQQSNIPKKVFDVILAKIETNNAIMAQVAKLESALEDVLSSEIKKEKKMSNEEISCPEARKLNEQIDELKSNIKPVSLEPVYVPNTTFHQQIWTNTLVESAFVPCIEQDVVKQIMELTIDDRLKILLLLGIGSFEIQENTAYTEIVKKLANNKQLLMIIASSDYIYGTNYQFCHELIGKDLTNMSQQKTIQALGRVGRNNIQQEYTARFRDDSIILNLFKQQEHNIEADTMCRLLKTDDDDHHHFHVEEYDDDNTDM
jgi:hypothetical protein